jgi:hypothetical protein
MADAVATGRRCPPNGVGERLARDSILLSTVVSVPVLVAVAALSD